MLQKSRRGIAILELLIYIAIFSGLVVTILDFSFLLSRGSAQAQTRDEVVANLQFAAARMSRDIRLASAVSVPSAGSSGNVLTLTVAGNPVTYQVASGVLQRIGTSTEAITSNNVIVATTSPIFTRIDQGAPAKSAITIDITMSYNNLDRPDWVYSEREVTTVGLR